ncbi:MAG: nucleotidyltransferase substrate binding protein [Deltaproteobacteria bacterium]|nr:nucleotidyltransferase substrate binding protein [Deltaproteobacteria bacterium]
MIDLSSLDKAVDSLGRAIAVSETQSETQAGDRDLRETIRAGVIQNFEFTYELCWKMLKRQLEATSPSSSSIDQMAFRDLIRTGAERGLVEDPKRWFDYRDQRNITSHTYDDAKAEAVYTTAVAFVHDARDLLTKLKARNTDD